MFCSTAAYGLRNTLYIKDDDYRLSYLQGTYITTTNLTKEDKDRIKSLRLGPFYISVHTTNPELRVNMLKNPAAADIMKNLTWFAQNEIPFHVQIVLCPGYNDGEELVRTLNDLSSLGDSLLSIAIVPVGLTQFHKNNLREVDKKIAEETVSIASNYPKAACSDEFFLLCDKEIPEADYYGNFSQLDDGVGSLRMLIDDFDSIELPSEIKQPLKVCFACSVAASKAFKYIAEKLCNIKNLQCTVKPVVSTYWGKNITVAGLITSEDLINTIKDVDADYVVVPSIMLKPFTKLFLDGASIDDVINKTGCNIYISKDNYSVSDVVDFVCNNNCS